MPRKSHKNKVYSAELKLQAVQDYLAGKIYFYNNARYQKRLRCMTPMEFHYAYAA